MRRPGKAADLNPARSSAPDLSLAELALRAGVSADQATAIFRRDALEPTYTIAETAQYLRCTPWQINKLVALGKRYGTRLHPTLGGLWPTFKPSHKTRLVPLSAIRGHLQHMARVHDRRELRTG